MQCYSSACVCVTLCTWTQCYFSACVCVCVTLCTWTQCYISACVCVTLFRSLGVHVSKVRSITLDSWEPELLRVMTELGNARVNEIFEAVVVGDSFTRPIQSSLRSQLVRFLCLVAVPFNGHFFPVELG